MSVHANVSILLDLLELFMLSADMKTIIKIDSKKNKIKKKDQRNSKRKENRNEDNQSFNSSALCLPALSLHNWLIRRCFLFNPHFPHIYCDRKHLHVKRKTRSQLQFTSGYAHVDKSTLTTCIES